MVERMMLLEEPERKAEKVRMRGIAREFAI